MDKRNEIINNVSGLLTDELCPLTDIIEAGGECFGYKPVTINFSINNLVKEGRAIKTKDKMVALVSNPVETPDASAIMSPETPKAPKAPKAPKGFGVTEMTREDGSTYKYRRSAFDGPEGCLDEEHEKMKDDFIFFSAILRKLEDNFEGAGPVAITLTYGPKFEEFKEDFEKFGNDKGKLFFRWDNGNENKPTQKVMDILYPTIKPLVETMKNIQAKKETEGVQ